MKTISSSFNSATQVNNQQLPPSTIPIKQAFKLFCEQHQQKPVLKQNSGQEKETRVRSSHPLPLSAAHQQNMGNKRVQIQQQTNQGSVRQSVEQIPFTCINNEQKQEQQQYSGQIHSVRKSHPDILQKTNNKLGNNEQTNLTQGTYENYYYQKQQQQPISARDSQQATSISKLINQTKQQNQIQQSQLNTERQSNNRLLYLERRDRGSLGTQVHIEKQSSLKSLNSGGIINGLDTMSSCQPSEKQEERSSTSQSTQSQNSSTVYLNLLLRDEFKVIYRQMDPLKKGYIKLKDLSEAVKTIEGEAKRNALIKFFVSFVKQTNKYYISKVSFLTNAVNAYLHKKYDMHLFVENIDKKLCIYQQIRQDHPPQQLKEQKTQPIELTTFDKLMQQSTERSTSLTFDNQTATSTIKDQQRPQGGGDEINMLYYKYFSGQVRKSNQLSKQNELYIQHLLAQSQAYQQQKKHSFYTQSNKENTQIQQRQSKERVGQKRCLDSNEYTATGSGMTFGCSKQSSNCKSQGRVGHQNNQNGYQGGSSKNSFQQAATQLRNNQNILKTQRSQSRSFKQSALDYNSSQEIFTLSQTTFDSTRGGVSATRLGHSARRK